MLYIYIGEIRPSWLLFCSDTRKSTFMAITSSKVVRWIRNKHFRIPRNVLYLFKAKRSAFDPELIELWQSAQVILFRPSWLQSGVGSRRSKTVYPRLHVQSVRYTDLDRKNYEESDSVGIL